MSTACKSTQNTTGSLMRPKGFLFLRRQGVVRSFRGELIQSRSPVRALYTHGFQGGSAARKFQRTHRRTHGRFQRDKSRGPRVFSRSAVIHGEMPVKLFRLSGERGLDHIGKMSESRIFRCVHHARLSLRRFLNHLVRGDDERRGERFIHIPENSVPLRDRERALGNEAPLDLRNSFSRTQVCPYPSEESSSRKCRRQRQAPPRTERGVRRFLYAFPAALRSRYPRTQSRKHCGDTKHDSRVFMSTAICILSALFTTAPDSASRNT